jgi:serine/threonine-protein kinase
MIQDEPGGQPIVKLLDFGLAKDLSKPTASEMELTGKQTIVGKAAYLSPEQARGGEVDGRSDVYGLGVTLYEALTGRLPFEGETDFQVLLAQINGNVPPFPKRWSTHPGASAVESVVLKALAKNPADRPATAGILSNLFQQGLTLSRAKRRLGWPLLATCAVLIISVVLLSKWLH